MRCGPLLLSAVIAFAVLSPAIAADDSPAQPAAAGETEQGDKDELVKLNPQGTVLMDLKGKRLLLKGKIVQREALLEFFCCLAQTMEHESIVAVDSKALPIHAGLLRIGANSGAPAKFEPEYQPPTGQVIDIFVQWRDKKKKLHRVRAQEWVQRATRRFYSVAMKKPPADLKIPADSELRYDKFAKELVWFGPMSDEQKKRMLSWSQDKDYRKAIESFYDQSQPRQMDAEWVFAGSQVVREAPNEPEYYLAESGQIVSVANFTSSMIDVAMRSTDAEANLLFEAATEKIPPLGTEVVVELIPRPEKVKPPAKPAEKKTPGPSEK